VVSKFLGQPSPKLPGSVPCSMKADDGGVWNNKRGTFGKEVRINS
jgi:hypothetical protein